MSIVEPDHADGADEYLRSQNWRTEPTPQGGAYDHVASAVHSAVVEHLTDVLSPDGLQAALDGGQGLRTTIDLALTPQWPTRLRHCATATSSDHPEQPDDVQCCHSNPPRSRSRCGRMAKAGWVTGVHRSRTGRTRASETRRRRGFGPSVARSTSNPAVHELPQPASRAREAPDQAILLSPNDAPVERGLTAGEARSSDLGTRGLLSYRGRDSLRDALSLSRKGVRHDDRNHACG